MMKSVWIAAALAAGAMIAPATAGAAPARHGWQHHGWKWKTVCTTKWRHGHKYRTCRKTRVRW